MKQELEIPEEQKQIVLKRIEKSRISPERMLDWDEVSNSLVVNLIN
ncbi:hypothetical protein [Flavobacterium piscisymbiosum]|uniref:Addiction module component n=1 Tax=Flavobacterium piscisymbiosum TaxID=2893753 RepID=A0ABS8MK13_9FLAO|nr:hypothetical protein [Flavobacterium sp. F-30]MCC9065824.1 hypothetical protein [Flavobacterium sp. F-30]